MALDEETKKQIRINAHAQTVAATYLTSLEADKSKFTFSGLSTGFIITLTSTVDIKDYNIGLLTFIALALIANVISIILSIFIFQENKNDLVGKLKNMFESSGVDGGKKSKLKTLDMLSNIFFIAGIIFTILACLLLIHQKQHGETKNKSEVNISNIANKEKSDSSYIVNNYFYNYNQELSARNKYLKSTNGNTSRKQISDPSDCIQNKIAH